MHVSDMPEQLRPYAFHLHAQCIALLQDMGVASVHELEQRVQEHVADFVPHAERIRRLGELLRELQSLLAAPKEYFAEQQREGAPQWLAHVRELLALMPESGNSVTDGESMEMVTLRLQQAEETVRGIPLTDAALAARMVDVADDGSPNQVAREAVAIAIEEKRYNLVLATLPQTHGEPYPPALDLVRAMVADGLFAEAEAIIEQLPSGSFGLVREEAYFLLAKALRAQGKPWREAYEQGVSSCTPPASSRRIRTSPFTRDFIMDGRIKRHAVALGTLGCGEEAARLFLCTVPDDEEADCKSILRDIVASGEYDGATEFMQYADMGGDRQREFVGIIAEDAVNTQSPDVDARIREAEQAFAETESASLRQEMAMSLAYMYRVRKEWDKIDALIPVIHPDGEHAELFRLVSRFTYMNDVAVLPLVADYVAMHPVMQELADSLFASAVEYFVVQGDLATAATWRAHIRNKEYDPWFAYFSYTLRSGDVVAAQKLFNEAVIQHPESYRIRTVHADLLTACVKVGDDTTMFDVLRTVRTSEAGRERMEKHSRYVSALLTVCAEARQAVQ